jgi:hypothetical protein
MENQDLLDSRLRLLEFESTAENSYDELDSLIRTPANSIASTSSGIGLSPTSPRFRGSATGIVPSEDYHKLEFAQHLLTQIGGLLHTADRELQTLENENLLGKALLRACHELAGAVGHLAQQLEQQTDRQRRELADSCLLDFQNSSRGLQLQQSGHAENDQLSAPSVDTDEKLTHDDFMSAIQATAELLRDVEDALRAVEHDEAEEIADVALATAHLFVASLQNVHSRMTPDDLMEVEGCERTKTIRTLQEHPNIEMLPDSEQETSPSKESQFQAERMRCLWPPLGPAVKNALQWSKETFWKQNLILTAALGIILWPVAVFTAVVGAPAVFVDNCLQNVYNTFQDGPAIQTAEVALAQAVNITKLTLLTGKAVAKPTLRVMRRQVQRHGPAVVDWAVNRIAHPVDTAVESAKGVWWCSERLINIVQEQIQRHQEAQQAGLQM